MKMRRRDFLGIAPAVLAAVATLGETPLRNPFPRWRGFNLPGAPDQIPEAVIYEPTELPAMGQRVDAGDDRVFARFNRDRGG